MPAFEYKGIKSSGKPVSGIVEAESDRQARSKLKSDGIFPSELRSVVEKKSGKSFSLSRNSSSPKVSATELSVATRQLATLFGAGIPLVEAIRALGEQLDDKKLKAVFANVGDEVNQGATLAKAMSEYPKVFPNLYVNMIASGEVSGTLEIVFDRLADLLESQAQLRAKIISAAIYPAIMLGMCVLVIVVLLTFVVPQIVEVFEGQGQELPVPTKIVIAVSDILRNFWFVFLGLVLGLPALIRKYLSTNNGRRQFDSLKLKLPLFGNLFLKVATARVCRTMGTMLQSGVALLTTLGVAESVAGNVLLQESIRDSAEGVKEGKSLADELKKSAKFPGMVTHLVRVGEKTGRLEEMLLRAAKSYETEVDTVVSGLTKIVEPILTVVFAVIVGGIVFAVMLPLLEMSSFGA